ncbi:hypothetical protein BE20_35895 [Sorangium cellulosum]|uniref:Uncharacterized protein n=1 Tax=Sorangium cellulosum TaxID=56 RepID=A0A150T0K4_SORCE|nr:hypothetical protein BE18_35835 [Sorangium cellulosum]KYF98196.1 hypothetical protein BE20_35895 [Sorangium cellulosum]
MKAESVFATLTGLGGAAVAASGCWFVKPYDCAERLECDVINEDGTSNGACEGKCVPEPLNGFAEEPELVWIGPEQLRPLACAGVLPGAPIDLSDSWTGRADMPDAPQCPACTCSAPMCELPAGVTARSLAVCQEGPGGVEMPFDAPPGWDGACVSPGTLPAERFGSYTIPPATERPCAPVPVDPPRAEEPQPRALGDLVAVACTGFVEEHLCDREPLCMLHQQRPPPGFRHCIFTSASSNQGPSLPCSDPAPRGGAPRYSDRFVFYRDVIDDRTCSACTCTSVTPSTCEARVSTYEDAACGQPVATTTVDGEGACVVPPSAMTLGSLSAEWLVNAPGSCAPRGGELTGTEPERVIMTLCCLPEDT